MNEFEPVSAPQRLRMLDVLRGCALLGILLMNIPYFAMPMAAYSQLNAWGGNDGANLWTFFIQWTLFEGKMRALFSILFGAGIVLFIEHATARRDSAEVGDLFVRRMLWLMLFGILHAWFIWYGDILYPYAICGLLIFPLRKLPPRTLFVTAAMSLLLLTGGLAGDAFDKQSQKEAGTAALAAEAAGKTLTEEQKDAKEAWTNTLEMQAPSREAMQEEVDAYRSGYAGALKQRAEVSRKFHFVPLYFPIFIDFWALMLIGMGLYQLGILQGDRSVGFYGRMAAIGYAVGLPLNATAAYLMYAWNFDFIGNEFANIPAFQVGRVATVLAHLSVIVIAVKRGWLTRLADRLAAVGRMAFSNYIAHSVICSLIFYNPGLALIGQLQRYQLYFIVLGIWAFNLLWSPWWLSRFRFGPLEWCWRSLTYWRRQPMRRPAPSAVQVGI
jgi:uncharacterized protein